MTELSRDRPTSSAKDGGKGDKARTSSAETRTAFSSGYDKIDWKNTADHRAGK